MALSWVREKDSSATYWHGKMVQCLWFSVKTGKPESKKWLKICLLSKLRKQIKMRIRGKEVRLGDTAYTISVVEKILKEIHMSIDNSIL